MPAIKTTESSTGSPHWANVQLQAPESRLSKFSFAAAGKARLLRVYIDKPGGVTHGDCELISQRSRQTAGRGQMPYRETGYTLEVSSPGVERKLSKARDFERVVGQKIRVCASRAYGRVNSLEGKLFAGLPTADS